ncbi:MAG: hypothetical protein M1839_009129 [Geoglossum umbratile]|nr:MAG: hypothetical protein M1839_009129 [Geoglossum umbratile]
MEYEYPAPDFGELLPIWRRQVVEKAMLRVFELASEPWVIRDSALLAAGASSGLCHICRRINFVWILQNDLSSHPWALDAMASYTAWDPSHPLYVQIPPTSGWHKLPRLPLGFLRDISQRRGCPFCRLVMRSICIALSTGLDALPSVVVKGYGKYPIGPDCPAQRAFCYLTNVDKGYSQPSGVYSLRVWITADHAFSELRAVDIHRLSDQPVPYEGRLVSSMVDFSMIQNWIQKSESRNNGSSGSKLRADTLRDFRLIDVVDQCIVRASPAWRYIALSYVWGNCAMLKNSKAEQERLSAPNALVDRAVPQTIRDAMVLVSRAKERYLWVDALCIIQDDEESKNYQIQAMDRVYSSAIATIVAAAGADPSAGLPGVQPGSRVPFQHIEIVRGMQLSNRWEIDTFRSTSPRDILNSLERCVWQFRGWTFQEYMLSKRLIFFLPNVVWLQCSDYVYEEDLHESHKVDLPKNDRFSILDVSSSIERDSLVNVDRYHLALYYYTQRKLSYDTDALNAFLAVLNILKPIFRGDFVCGLPAMELEHALLWRPGSTMRRRKHPSTKEPIFPSWSWAGWAGTVAMPNREKQFSRITWIDAIDGTRFTTHDIRGIEDPHKSGWIPRFQHQEDERDERQFWFEPGRPALAFLHPVAPPPNGTHHRFVQPGRELLTFEALAATLPMEPGRMCMSRLKRSTPRHLSEEIRSYTVLDITKRDKYHAGVVYLHHESVKPGDKISFPYEMIVVSRTTHPRVGTRSGKPPDDDSDLYAWAKEFSPEEWENREKGKGKWFKDASSLLGNTTDLGWPIYDVLVVTWKGDVAFRVGAGIVYAETFHYANPVRKRITLG